MLLLIPLPLGCDQGHHYDAASAAKQSHNVRIARIAVDGDGRCIRENVAVAGCVDTKRVTPPNVVTDRGGHR